MFFDEVKTPPTNYRARLASPDATLRTAVEQELAGLGPSTGDALLAEIDFVVEMRRGHLKLFYFAAVMTTIIYAPLIFALIAKEFTWKQLGSLGFLFFVWTRQMEVKAYTSQCRTLALALARRDDLRAIGPLLELLPRHRPTSRRADADAERVTTELTRLLLLHRDAPGAPAFTEEFATLVHKRIAERYPTGRLRRPSTADFTDAEADLLATLVTVLAARQERDAARAFVAPTRDAPPATVPGPQASSERATPAATAAAVPLTLRRP